MIRTRSAALCAALLPALAAAPALAQVAPGEGPATLTPRPTTAPISPQDAAGRLYAFAHDSMMGREAGTLGNVKATDWLAREARRLGLEPAGENGTYFQTIGLASRGVDPASRLAVGGQALALGTDFVPLPSVSGFLAFGTRFQGNDVPVVYGGTLGTADVIPPAQAQGKFVVFSPPRGPNGQPVFQFWAAGTLERYAGAAGVAIATLDATPPQLLEFFAEEQVVLAGLSPETPAPAGVIVTRAVAERLLGAPLGSQATGTAGGRVSGAFRFVDAPTEHPARNVIAVLRGSDPRLAAEYVAIGSHNDHDGMDPASQIDHDSLRVFNRVLRRTGAEGAPRPATPEALAQIRAGLDSLRAIRPARRDTVMNGADDDGSGSVAMLEIAEAMVAGPRPKRSILFVWHTAEEKGLLGSEWFSERPTVPREAIVAQLNIDMIGRGKADDEENGGPAFLQLVGSRRLSTQLGDAVETANRRQRAPFTFDYSMDADGHPSNIYCRSDHYHYARYGIPVTFFTTGVHRDYHMLTDEPQYIDYTKLAAVTQLIHDVAMDVANAPARPVVDKPVPDPKAPCQQ